MQQPSTDISHTLIPKANLTLMLNSQNTSSFLKLKLMSNYSKNKFRHRWTEETDRSFLSFSFQLTYEKLSHNLLNLGCIEFDLIAAYLILILKRPIYHLALQVIVLLPTAELGDFRLFIIV